MSRYGEVGATIQRSNALRHGAGALRPERDTARDRVCVVIQFLYRDRRGATTWKRARATRSVTWPVRAATRPGTATIQPSEHHDTALCARPRSSACAMCVQPRSLGVHPVHLTQF